MRKQKQVRDAELTAMFKLVGNPKLREYLKRIHESLKFSTVDTQRQKSELAELQKKVGFSLLTLTFIVLLITIVFASHFESDELRWGFLHVRAQRIPGYVIVFFYALLMLVQFSGMLFYRFGIVLYKVNRWRVACSTAIYVGDETTIRTPHQTTPGSSFLTPSNSNMGISSRISAPPSARLRLPQEV